MMGYWEKYRAMKGIKIELRNQVILLVYIALLADTVYREFSLPLSLLNFN